MQKANVRFNEKDRPEFYRELRSRVNNYFKESKKEKFANANMVFKSIFMLALYFTPFIIMITGIVSSTLGILLLWSLMGLGIAGIGLSIMHDANHGSYSSNDKVNSFMGFSLNYLGGYPLNWKIQHNLLHHTYTNIDGFDEDFDKKEIIRFSPTQEKKPFFRFQLLYAPIIYASLTLYWVLAKDYIQLFDYNKRGLLKTQNITFGKALFQIIFYKVVYFGALIFLPIFLTGIPWWLVITGFLLMQGIGGLILALVFQCAHVLTETEFYHPEDVNNSENNWAIHQMKTTSNFAVRNAPLTWLLGGLNYQVEHHLFPTICHVHYPAISKIVRKTAEEYDVPYLEHKTFVGAIANHFSFLHQLGTGKI